MAYCRYPMMVLDSACLIVSMRWFDSEHSCSHRTIATHEMVKALLCLLPGNCCQFTSNILIYPCLLCLEALLHELGFLIIAAGPVCVPRATCGVQKQQHAPQLVWR